MILSRMIRVSYLIWPPENDVHHEEVYSPGLMERATDRRRFYLKELARHNSRDALDALDELICDSRLAKFRDSFLYERDQVVRNSARRPSYTVDEAINFLNGVSKRPTTVIEFRDLIRRHLSGLLYQLRNSDNDESYVFRRGDATEDDLRNWLSARLRERGDDYYTVVREQEVAVENRPDLRVHSRDAELGFVSIEIKMADENHWSGDILIEKIETQLADLYLLEEGSHTGLYLLANGAKPTKKELDKDGNVKRKAFRKKVAGRWTTFAELIELAKARAVEVTSALPGNKVVEIVGIDLSER